MNKINAIKQLKLAQIKIIPSNPQEIHDQYELNNCSFSELNEFLFILRKKRKKYKLGNTGNSSPNISDNNSIIWNHATLDENQPMINLNLGSDIELSDLGYNEESFESIKSIVKVDSVSTNTNSTNVRNYTEEVEFSKDLDIKNTNNSSQNLMREEECKSKESQEIYSGNTADSMVLTNINEEYKNKDITNEDKVFDMITPIQSTEKQNKHEEITTSTQIEYSSSRLKNRRKYHLEFTKTQTNNNISNIKGRRKNWTSNPYTSISNIRLLEDIRNQKVNKKRIESKNGNKNVSKNPKLREIYKIY